MDLRRYLFEKRMTQTDFAKKVGCSPNYICMVCRGRIVPFKPLAKAIKEATNGIVDYTQQVQSYSEGAGLELKEGI